MSLCLSPWLALDREGFTYFQHPIHRIEHGEAVEKERDDAAKNGIKLTKSPPMTINTVTLAGIGKCVRVEEVRRWKFPG